VTNFLLGESKKLGKELKKEGGKKLQELKIANIYQKKKEKELLEKELL
jgi:hypothetical protein